MARSVQVAGRKLKAAQVLSRREMLAISRAISDPRRFEILQHIAAASCAACSDLRSVFPIYRGHALTSLKGIGILRTHRNRAPRQVCRHDVLPSRLGRLFGGAKEDLTGF